jgi:amino acid transporter
MIRGVGPRGAVAINVATMIGAGPLITIPLVVEALHGSISVWVWLAGATIAACDGLCYAELASLFPQSGGTYAYLREALGPRFGRPAAFLYVWQFIFWAPLTLASGYIGFAQYAAFIVPAFGRDLAPQLLAMCVGLITLASLYRTIPRVTRTALWLGITALLTLAIVAFCGVAHPSHSPLPAAFSTSGFDLAALGSALVIVLYDYAGYTGICALGDEIIAAPRTVPRAIIASIALVAGAYLLLNLGVFALLSPQEVRSTSSLAAVVVERAFGHSAAIIVTFAILITAFASTYGLLLSAARVPYAAARDGDFLAAFARLHPSKRFPDVALVTIGLLALPAAFLPLDHVIAALTAGIVLIAGMTTNLAVIVARSRGLRAPFRLPLYPLPVILAGLSWLGIFWSSGAQAMTFGLVTLAGGGIVYATLLRRAR